jgi:hypothetical protein
VLPVAAPTTDVLAAPVPQELPQVFPAPDDAAAAGPDTEVLGSEFSSDPGTATAVEPPTSLASTIGRYALPIGIAVGLAFAITGVGAAERVKERWRDR